MFPPLRKTNFTIAKHLELFKSPVRCFQVLDDFAVPVVGRALKANHKPGISTDSKPRT